MLQPVTPFQTSGGAPGAQSAGLLVGRQTPRSIAAVETPPEPAQIEEKRITVRGHRRAFRQRDRERHRLHSWLHGRQTVGADRKQTIRVERRRATLKLRQRNISDDLAHAIVGASAVRIDFQILNGRRIFLRELLGQIGKIGDHVTGRENGGCRDVGRVDVDLLQCVPKRRERCLRGSSMRGGWSPSRSRIPQCWCNSEHAPFCIFQLTTNDERVRAFRFENDSRTWRQRRARSSAV